MRARLRDRDGRARGRGLAQDRSSRRCGSRTRGGRRWRRRRLRSKRTECDPETKAGLTGFEEGLQQLGWVQGRNISIDYRWADGDLDRLGTYAAELVRMAPDVLFAAATPALEALRQQTHSLPIVFVQV